MNRSIESHIRLSSLPSHFELVNYFHCLGCRRCAMDSGEMNPLLERCTISDIPLLAEIFTEAFLSDTHTALKAASQPPGSQEQGMSEGLEYWMSRPQRQVVLKARLGSEIAGWVCWGWHGIEVDVEGYLEDISYMQRSLHALPAVTEDETIPEPFDQALRNHGNNPLSGLEVLESITNADMDKWQRRFMPSASTRCMILVAIAVHPSHQGKGVGHALIDWGLEIADQQQALTWVSGSDAGWPVFEKKGFRLYGGLTAKLDDFADGVRQKDGEEWGEYTWRYGKRLPNTSPQA